MSTGAANRLLLRFGSRPLAVAGLLMAAAGLAGLGHVRADGSYYVDVLPALVVVGLGAGLSFVSITTAALARVDEAGAGLASGLLSTSALIGGALGISVLVAVVSARSNDLLASGTAPLLARVGGLQLGFLVAAGFSLAASLIAFLAPREAKVGASVLAAIWAPERS